MHLETLATLLLIGAIAGFLASTIDDGYGFGIRGNIFVGIVGAVLAGAMAPPFGQFPGADTLGQVVSGTIGASVLLVLTGLVRWRA